MKKIIVSLKVSGDCNAFVFEGLNLVESVSGTSDVVTQKVVDWAKMFNLDSVYFITKPNVFEQGFVNKFKEEKLQTKDIEGEEV